MVKVDYSPKVKTGFVTKDNQMFTTKAAANKHSLELMFNSWFHRENKVHFGIHTFDVADFIMENRDEIARMLDGE